mmetsp:Transcript_19821/g.63048  ORF Transcript_19821/g.63048 Transcript_19821/m.63048 type:complete len:209 (-) Transcript_19821:187-813(-)
MSVTLVTSHGDITIDLFHRDTPRTSRNFIELARHGYYDGLLVHRIVQDFIMQAGDPSGDGTGGESIYGRHFNDEILGRLGHGAKGMVGMANSGRNTNGSQFFITFNECSHLDGRHTVFGRVVEGLDVVDYIQLVKVDKKGKPIKPVKIFTAHVNEDPWEGQPLPEGARLPLRTSPRSAMGMLRGIEDVGTAKKTSGAGRIKRIFAQLF